MKFDKYSPGFLQCFGAVGWVIWPVKIVPEMTYVVSSGTLNLCSINHKPWCGLAIDNPGRLPDYVAASMC